MLRYFTLISLLLFAIYWFHIRVRPQDIALYNQLVEESTHLRTRHALEDEPAHQKRQNVQKDIWTQNQTCHFLLQSADSDLTLFQKKDKIEATESLKTIHCNLRDEFFFSADEGLYTYPSHQFTAKKNCRLLQKENRLEGTALHFDLIQETLTYEDPQGTLPTLTFTAKKLIWDKKANLLHLIDDVHIEQPGGFNLVAELGTVELTDLHPTLVTLEGKVRLLSSRFQNKPTYALADTLTYHPADQTLLFSATHKVLCWQEGLSLSANEVLIRQDQTIEGHGDVHFSFDLEEQNSIDNLFKQYL
jgi:lipopolysaccharide export system protein LptA